MPGTPIGPSAPAVSCGAMMETRESLEARKRELFDAIRTLQRDREDGTVDEGAYGIVRRRYESEAARVEERLDGMPPDGAVPAERERRTLWLAAPAAGLVIAAVAILLIGALRQRNGNQTITGDIPTASVPATAIQIAQRQVAVHPRSVDAQLALGNAYLNAGKDAQADLSYQAAMRLDPRRPEAPTFRAMVLMAGGKSSEALTQLSTVERTHPDYARAWLLDGLIASKSPTELPRARRAWKRFLVLQPHSVVSQSVRTWLKQLK